MQSEPSDNKNMEAEPQSMEGEMEPQSMVGERKPQTCNYALSDEAEIDAKLKSEDVTPDELEDSESSSGCEINGLIAMIFNTKMDHKLCPIHPDVRGSEHLLPKGKEGPIYNITASKLQPPINRSMYYNSRNADISTESQPSTSVPMDICSSSGETNRHTFKQFPVHDKKETISAQIPITLPVTYLHLYFEPDHTIWAKISSSKQCPNDTVYKLKIFSQNEIIMGTKNRSCLIINLPQLQDLEEKWLEGDPGNKADIPCDKDLRSLYHIYLDIMLDPVKINLFRRVNNNRKKKSAPTEVAYNVDKKKCHDFSKSFKMSSVIKKDPKSLRCLTVGQNSVLPLKLKLNAYMHLNDFVQNCVLGLSHEEAKSKIWQSYEYGFLYDKLQDFYITTEDCSLVHVKELSSSVLPNFADAIKGCPFYQVIEDPIPSNNRVRFRCPKSSQMIFQENEAKKYVAEAAKLKHLPFSEFVKEVAKLRSSLPKSLQLPE